MKNFSRTYPGKAILFFICVCSLVALFVSVCGIFFLWGSDAYSYDYYTYCREYMLTIFRNDAYRHTENILFNGSSNSVGSSLRFGLFENKECIYLAGGTDFDRLFWDNAYELDVSSLVNDMITGGAETSVGVKGAGVYTFRGYIDESFAGLDDYAIAEKLSYIYFLQKDIYLICIGLLILFIAAFLGLMCASARQPNSDDLYPGPFNSIPFDILALVSAGIVVIIVLFGDELFDLNTGFNVGTMYSSVFDIVYCIGASVIIATIIIALSMSFSARIKGKCLISGLFCAKILCLMFKAIRILFIALRNLFVSVPLVWKGILVYLIISLGELYLITEYYYYNVFELFLLFKAIMLPVVVYCLIMLRRLKKGAEALSNGDLDRRIDTSKMVLDLKEHGDNLNSILDGMSIAVDERLKSERMKTELITNVSHDIKTPLTSIINYSDLISKEQCENPKITEYSAVLLRQSERLKRLITDLVEASKASTGNLEVELSPSDAGVMLSQLCGEYEEKMGESGLLLISRCFGEKVMINADGRRMMRVFDNLMNNIAKYSLPGTRVYVSLEKHLGNAVFTFKNTSREPLNLSPDELMERFVRGDSSRHTEGNGLGLSIARSLTELQGGTFSIDIDGDLFKVTLTFPTI